MNRATPGQPEDQEKLMGRLIRTAGDPTVVPRAEYIASLRASVLEHLGPPQPSPRRSARLLIGSGMAALVLTAVVLALVLLRPANMAWAQVAKALQEQPWVHTRTLGPDGKQSGEAWLSPKWGVLAARHGPHVEYHDRALRTFTKYIADEGVIYRLPERAERMADGLEVYQQLLDAKGPMKSPVPGMDVVAENRRDVTEGGRTWQEIELTLKAVAGDRQQRLRFRIDPRTKLPHSCIFQSVEGLEGTTLFDYPDHGPADIYALGAPRTAKVIDRIPSDDLGRVFAGLKAGRVRFDDYHGIMDWGDGMNAKRICRKGRKWRVELLESVAKPPPFFPRDADAAWWKAHQDDFAFTVQAICDGEKVYHYGAGGLQSGPAARGPRPWKLLMTQAVSTADDFLVPWPDFFIEYLSHPEVGPPVHGRDFLLDLKPDDGPPGTIRLRVRDIRYPNPDDPDLYKLWIDPAAGYVVLRSETSLFTSIKPRKIGYIETKVSEQLAQSPSGCWYPTQVRRTTLDSNVEQIWKYHLDFDAPLPDELFRPLE